MPKRIKRPSVRDGYDRWSAQYDRTPNPLVALDRRHTVKLLRPQRGERLLDAGCGTGAHLEWMLAAGSRPVGLDLWHGMLQIARRKYPTVPVVQADLHVPLPVRRDWFDAVLCALVGEHLSQLALLFREFHATLVTGGRLVFSVFHPEMAAAGIEANFELAGTEYRLGAERHTVADYRDLISQAGFRDLKVHEFRGDEALVQEMPDAKKYLDRPLLLAITAHANR